MTKRMLIDATHEEETRVAITEGNKLIEYDYESQSRKPLKGNIFLAKVTRVEPSLQAAFVNFGGNRHGFLPFSEIHPDYFRIPVSDREALMAEQEEYLKRHDEEEQALDEMLGSDEQEQGADAGADSDIEEDVDAEDEVEEIGGSAGDVGFDDAVLEEENDNEADTAGDIESSDEEIGESDDAQEISGNETDDADIDASDMAEGDDNQKGDAQDEEGDNDGDKRDARRRGRGRGRGRRSQYRNRSVECVGGEEVDQEQRFRFNLRRKYKIQEVIKRGQIMLIQVNKEERGNKGAAVGSYLSLPGRYCVLMPNSPRAGGVSRKIANHNDRARMREIVKDLEVPKGMSVIVRTAGVSRTKNEIKRDLDYLMRLWDSIRELTLESTAPAMVYEEADLIKRSVRDLYTRDVEEIIVSGEEGYKIAKSFMKMMIPSHIKKVVKYEDLQLPLFNRYQIENQINEIGRVEVRLKSGGYLVINPTEALISIDVNSGKSTKGRHIEETALKTNIEAADEVARQLRLRDLGGLVVIDFIDMEDRRNNAKVERRMKDALTGDRARVQVGRISSFGLMELSRQRINPSLTEAQYEKCKRCGGVGIVPTSEAMSIMVIRAIEEEGILGRASQVIVQVNNEIALYLLNHKRRKLSEIEQRYNFEVLLRVDDEIPAAEYIIEVSKPSEKSAEKDAENKEEDGNRDVQIVSQEAPEEQDDNDGVAASRKRNRRGRGRSKSRERSADDVSMDDENENTESVDAPDAKEEIVEDSSKEDRPRPKRRPRSRARDKSRKDEGVETGAESATVFVPIANAGAYAEAVEQKEIVKVDAKAVVAEDDKKSVIKAGSKPRASAAKKPAKQSSEPVKKDYEIVNKPPEVKKKGWWNRLVE